MPRSLGVIPLLILVVAKPGGAQPILTEVNTLGPLVGFSVRYSVFSAELNEEAEQFVSAAGENQIWDVSMLTLGEASDQVTYYSSPQPSMPAYNDPRLADANLVAIAGPSIATWTYQRLDATGQVLLGRITLRDVDRDGRKDTLTSMYDPPSLVFPFPLTMGTAWEDSSQQTLEFQESPPVPVETVVGSHVVEGWGTLVSPEGSSPALRIRSDVRVTDAGGQHERRRTIRLVAPIPETLEENVLYGSRVDMSVDSLDVLTSFQYVAFSASIPTANEAGDELPTRVAIGANYPNPFRWSTTLPFEIDLPQQVRIAAYDVVGREVGTLLHQPLPAGRHTVVWDPKGLSSGVYRIVITSKSGAKSRLVVLIR